MKKANSHKRGRTWKRNSSKTAILRANDKGPLYEKRKRLARARREDTP